MWLVFGADIKADLKKNGGLAVGSKAQADKYRKVHNSAEIKELYKRDFGIFRPSLNVVNQHIALLNEHGIETTLQILIRERNASTSKKANVKKNKLKTEAKNGVKFLQEQGWQVSNSSAKIIFIREGIRAENEKIMVEEELQSLRKDYEKLKKK
eukprot:172712_1